MMSAIKSSGMRIDHGAGLMTCCAHLARQLVQEGEFVQRGQAIAITGYSGLDSLVTFPFGTPHVHFNTWLNGEPVDPFPYANEISNLLDQDKTDEDSNVDLTSKK